jgi:hypothetical protein
MPVGARGVEPAQPGLSRLRRFRGALVALMVIPWGLTGVLVILRGTPVRLDVLAFGLALDAVLLFVAWRKPWGVATYIVVLRFLLYAVLDLWVGHTVLLVVYGTFDAVAAVVLAAMTVAMQGDRRRHRAELREFEARIDADGPWEVRQAARGWSRRARRGYV